MHETNNESGQASVEYALVLLLVAIVLASSLVVVTTPFPGYVARLAASLG